MAFFWLIVADYYSGKIRDKVRIARLQEKWFPVKPLWYEKMSNNFPLEHETKKATTPTKNVVFFGFPLCLIVLYSEIIAIILSPPIPVISPTVAIPLVEILVACALVIWLLYASKHIDSWTDPNYQHQIKVFIICASFLFAVSQYYLRQEPLQAQMARNTLDALYQTKQPKKKDLSDN